MKANHVLAMDCQDSSRTVKTVRMQFLQTELRVGTSLVTDIVLTYHYLAGVFTLIFGNGRGGEPLPPASNESLTGLSWSFQEPLTSISRVFVLIAFISCLYHICIVFISRSHRVCIAFVSPSYSVRITFLWRSYCIRIAFISRSYRVRIALVSR